MLTSDRGGAGSRRPGQYHGYRHPYHLIGVALALGYASSLAAQSGLLEARIVEGDGQVSTPGTRLSRPLIVEVTDETGTHVEDAIVSFRVPDDGITGTFRNGLKTEILRTNGDGRAALRTLMMGGLAGQFQVRLTVAKGEARAGTISTQFIAPDERRHFGLGALRPHGRVLEIGALLLAAAAAGIAKTALSSRSGGASASQPPVIGPPTVTVGRP